MLGATIWFDVAHPIREAPKKSKTGNG